MKKSSTSTQILNEEAFRFLSQCNVQAKINWTTANPIFRGSMPSYLQQPITPEDLVSYRRIGGELVLIAAAKEYFARHGLDCSDSNVIIGSGIVNLFGHLCKVLKLKENNQDILLSTPIYGNFYQHCQRNGIKTDLVSDNGNWELYLDNLDKKLKANPNIKALLINYPNNPSGRVMTKEMLDGFSKVLQKYPDVLIISDELVIDLVFDPLKPNHSPASVPELKSRTIVLNSPAKSRPVAATGVSFAYFPDHIAELYRSGHIQEFPTPMLQRIVAKSLENTEENQKFLAADIEQYRVNIVNIKSQIDLLNKRLNQHFEEKGKTYIKLQIENIEGGNTCVLDFSALKTKSLSDGKNLATGLDVARLLLDKAGIGVVPGECFIMPPEEMLVRVPLSVNPREMSMGFDLIGKALTENLVRGIPSNTPSSETHEANPLLTQGRKMSKM